MAAILSHPIIRISTELADDHSYMNEFDSSEANVSYLYTKLKLKL